MRIIDNKEPKEFKIIENATSYNFIPDYRKISIVPDDKSVCVCDFLIIYTGEPEPEMSKSIILFINNMEIESFPDRKVVKLHNLNSAFVDVSVFNENNLEVMIGLEIQDSNNIILDFSRVNIPSGVNWKILVEA